MGGFDGGSDSVTSAFEPRPNEQILWTGKPYRGPIALRGRDAFEIPFFVIWCCLVYFVLGPELLFRKPDPVSLIGYVFGAVGFYLVFGRFLHNWYKRSRLTYLLTTERAIILRSGLARSHRTRPISDRTTAALEVGRDKRGTIFFSRPQKFEFRFAHRRFFHWREVSDTGVDGFQFYRIEDSEIVANVIADQVRIGANRRRHSKPAPFPQRSS